MIRPSFLAGLLLAGSALLAPPPAQAWSAMGHRLVARLAEPRLSAPVREEVQRLLALEGHRSLADVAAWADELRSSDPDLGRKSTRWHFVNIGELGCRYDAEAACAKGDCVVAAIDRQSSILADRSRPDAERLQALKFVVHFVGDVHQPMHAGNARDRGGNTVQVNIDGEGSNLHALWDGKLLTSAGLREDAYERRLREAGPVADGTRPVTARDAAAWAEQSCRIAVAPGVVPRKARIDSRYLQQHRPTAERQLRLAGEHLAGLLDVSLR